MTTLTQDVIAYLIDCAIGNREFKAIVRESATRDPDGSIMRNNFIYAVATGEAAESEAEDCVEHAVLVITSDFEEDD